MPVTMSDVPLTVLLREQSPRDAAICGVPLRPHQQAALARCRQIEGGTLDASELLRTLEPSYTIDCLQTRVGAICDLPGSGKSLVAIALCAGDTPVPPPVRRLSYCGGLVSYQVIGSGERRMRMSVIVVPHGIMPQWALYLADSGVSHFVFSRRSSASLSALDDVLMALDPPRILLCSSTNYGTVFGALDARSLCVDRLIVDEADSIALGRAPLAAACMYWSITASVSTLLNPRGTYVRDEETGNWLYERPLKSEHMRAMWASLEKFPCAARLLVLVKSAPEFVEASLALEDVETQNVLCAAPAGAAFLGGLVDHEVMQALHTDDVPLALSLIGNKGTADNVVASVRAVWDQAISEAAAVVSAMAGLDSDVASDAVRDAQRKIKLAKGSIAALDERVRGEQLCAICYEAPAGRTLMPCCSSVYCVRCIATWLDRRPTCPMCRMATSFSAARVIDDTCGGGTIAAAQPRLLGKTETAVRLVTSILESDPSRRVIVACANSGLFQTLMTPLARYGMAPLKGSGASIAKTVAAFRAGTQRIVFVSGDCYCTGINLPFATDVVMFHRMSDASEEQIVGRAQRPGRAGRLRVWRMVHAGERGAEESVDATAAFEAAA